MHFTTRCSNNFFACCLNRLTRDSDLTAESWFPAKNCGMPLIFSSGRHLIPIVRDKYLEKVFWMLMYPKLFIYLFFYHLLSLNAWVVLPYWNGSGRVGLYQKKILHLLETNISATTINTCSCQPFDSFKVCLFFVSLFFVFSVLIALHGASYLKPHKPSGSSAP